jgi:hypothetical protein
LPLIFSICWNTSSSKDIEIFTFIFYLTFFCEHRLTKYVDYFRVLFQEPHSLMHLPYHSAKWYYINKSYIRFVEKSFIKTAMRCFQCVRRRDIRKEVGNSPLTV